jgi:hypothetical protein
MTKFSEGDDIIVDFGGLDHRAEVVRHSNGWVLAVIVIDPQWDYGRQGARLVPHSTVCVPEKRVKHAE